jgi:aldose 1-epimerase
MHFSQLDHPKNIKSFGTLSNGKEVLCYTLKNKNGMELSVINYGATITSLKFPLSKQEKIDVVLGFDSLADYIASYDLPSAPYFGAVIGRFAGRINQATFSLNGKEINLTKNHGVHQLHGGVKGFSQQFWKVKKISEGDYPSITLEYISLHLEENYPGILMAEVTYMLTESNQVIVEFHAHSTEDTLLNLTQHSYFNLDGHQGNVTNQDLIIHSASVLTTDEENIPSGLLMDLKNGAFDFSTAKKVPITIDNTFPLTENQKVAAVLTSEQHNLKMTVLTDQPAIHIYVGGNCFGQIKGKEAAAYHPGSGICFETQNYPDAPNHKNFPSAVLKKGEHYHHQTIFAFETL